jgi:ribose transport system substrate-binding protein
MGTRRDDVLADMTTRRRFLQRGAVAGVGLAGFAALAGCGSDDDDTATTGGAADSGGGERLRIAYGYAHQTAPVYVPMLAGAKVAAERLNVEMLEGHSNADLAKQIGEINAWIAQDVDAMLIEPLDLKAVGPLVKKAQDAGIVYVSYASAVEGQDGVVLFDEPQGAKAMGETIAAWINEKQDGNGVIALLTFDQVEVGRQRINIAMEQIEKLAPKSKVVARQNAVLAPDALKVVPPILEKNPDVNVILCIADDGALGARQAYLRLKRSPEDVFIAGSDGSKEALEKVILPNDPIKAVAALDLTKIGEQSIQIPYNIVKGEGPKEYVAPYDIITVDKKAAAEKLISAFGGA